MMADPRAIYLFIIKEEIRVSSNVDQKAKIHAFIKFFLLSRTPWSCGLVRHVLDRKVEGSNLAVANFLFDQISSRKSEQKLFTENYPSDEKNRDII